MDAYAARCRSAFYDVGTSNKLLTNPEVVATLVRSYAEPTKFWVEKIVGIDRQSFEDIFNRIANAFISNKAAEFAIRLLLLNQRKIKEIADGA